MKVLEIIVIGGLIGLGASDLYSQDKKMHKHKYEMKMDSSCQHHDMDKCMMDKDMMMPKVKKQVSPVYPRGAKEQGAEGLVYICAHVNEKGLVEKVHVSKSSGRNDLDSSAVESVKKYEFEPGMKNGKCVHTHVTIPVKYKLH